MSLGFFKDTVNFVGDQQTKGSHKVMALLFVVIGLILYDYATLYTYDAHMESKVRQLEALHRLSQVGDSLTVAVAEELEFSILSKNHYREDVTSIYDLKNRNTFPTNDSMYIKIDTVAMENNATIKKRPQVAAIKKISSDPRNNVIMFITVNWMLLIFAFVAVPTIIGTYKKDGIALSIVVGTVTYGTLYLLSYWFYKLSYRVPIIQEDYISLNYTANVLVTMIAVSIFVNAFTPKK